MIEVVSDGSIQFEPSAECKKLWAATHQGPMTMRQQFHKGLHGREATPTWDVLLVCVAVGSEGYGAWMLSKFTGYPLLACLLAPLVVCILLAIVGHIFVAEEHILRCRQEVEIDGNKAVQLKSAISPKLLWRRIWSVPIAFVALVNAGAFLLARPYVDIRMFLTIGAFFLAAAIHITKTGAVWASLRFRFRLRGEYKTYARSPQDGEAGGKYRFGGSRVTSLAANTEEGKRTLTQVKIEPRSWLAAGPFLARTDRHYITHEQLVINGMLSDDQAATLATQCPDDLREGILRLLRLHQLEIVTQNPVADGNIIPPPPAVQRLNSGPLPPPQLPPQQP